MPTINSTKAVVGETLPDFVAQATSFKDITPQALKGYQFILYFYPKDSTPGCTQESQEFKQFYNQFKRVKTCIFGISRDSMESHERFKKALSLPFELISDPDENLCRLFDVIQIKTRYGREILGVERSTFLIDTNGKLRQAWRNVKVAGHVESVFASAEALYHHPA